MDPKAKKMKPKLLHVVPRLNYGGGGISVLYENHFLDDRFSYEIITLEPKVDNDLLRKAFKKRIRIHIQPNPIQEANLIKAADIVVLQFWQAPCVFYFLKRMRATKVRLLLYPMINNLYPPQVIHPDILELSDGVISTSATPIPLDKPSISVPALISPVLLNEPLRVFHPSPLAVHCNTLNESKMHPDFEQLHKNIPVEIYGRGEHEDKLKQNKQMKLKGFVPSWWKETKANALSYPIHPYTYASSDKVIQEAMFLGMPTFLLRPTPLEKMTIGGAYIADDYHDYRTKLLEIITDRDSWEYYSNKARQWAHEKFHPQKNSIKIQKQYEHLLDYQKTEKSFNVPKADYLAYVHNANFDQRRISVIEGGVNHWNSETLQ